MADKHKAEVQQNAVRVAQWLLGHSAEFEQQGINENNMAAAVGLTDPDAEEAVDYLENREEIVRMPKALTPPQFVLKPGRGWPDVQQEILKKGVSG